MKLVGVALMLVLYFSLLPDRVFSQTEAVECHRDPGCFDPNLDLLPISNPNEAEATCCGDVTVLTYRVEGSEQCGECPEGRTPMPTTETSTATPTSTVSSETTTQDTTTATTATTETTVSTEGEGSEGESTGSKCKVGCIAGIVVAGILLLLLIVAAVVGTIVYCVYHHQQQQQYA